jgi:hypothetical protein
VEGGCGEGKKQSGDKEFEGVGHSYRHAGESSTERAGGTRWRRRFLPDSGQEVTLILPAWRDSG